MLDIRAVAYISPLAEVEFTDVPLTVRIVNFGDEPAEVTGLFRVYNDTTGELIHSSEIQPFRLSNGLPFDAPALTDFVPPAPLDDTYFVTFDGHASNALVPAGISFALGAFHFDVKPGPLGPPPAAHATTHEEGGADPIEASDLGTSELDDTLVLQPDGAGGVEWNPSPGGVSDHGALTGLADDDHTQYRLRHEIFYETDFLNEDIYDRLPIWRLVAIASGDIVQQAGEAAHPGALVMRSSVNANSGYSYYTYLADILLAGGEESRLWHKPQILSGTTRHHGFLDSLSPNLPTDGAWIWQDPADGKIYGRTRSNGVGSTTASGFQLVTDTWYLEVVRVNADASQVDFYCYSNAGAELWHDSLATNIPTGAGRLLGHSVSATNSGTTSVWLTILDYMSMLIPDRRPNP